MLNVDKKAAKKWKLQVCNYDNGTFELACLLCKYEKNVQMGLMDEWGSSEANYNEPNEFHAIRMAKVLEQNLQS